MSDDFLIWVRKRKDELHRELHELEAAERVYRESGFRTISHPQLPFQQFTGYERRGSKRPPKTIKEAVIQVLESAPDYGLTANEILQRLQETYDSTLVRTSLSPQLSRLKGDNIIASDRPFWKLVRNHTGLTN